jgi:hypothetical protein
VDRNLNPAETRTQGPQAQNYSDSDAYTFDSLDKSELTVFYINAKDCGLIIDFNDECISYRRDGILRKCGFSQRRISEVDDSSSLSQDCLFNNSFPRSMTPTVTYRQWTSQGHLQPFEAVLKGPIVPAME